MPFTCSSGQFLDSPNYQATILLSSLLRIKASNDFLYGHGKGIPVHRYYLLRVKNELLQHIRSKPNCVGDSKKQKTKCFSYGP